MTSEKTILDQFTPNVLGLFWLTNTKLNRELDGFDEFNYLFDGLLSQYLYGQEEHIEKRAHIFFTKNFNDRVFLAHIKTDQHGKAQVAGDIDEQIALIPKNLNDKKTILIFDGTNDNWIAELKKRYSQFDFQELKK